jgi:CarboxypepD_reg-like domain
MVRLLHFNILIPAFLLKILLSMVFVTFANLNFSQTKNTYKIAGNAISISGKPLEGCSIIINKNKGTTTDTTGKFTIYGLAKGKYKLSIRSLGYKKMDTVLIISDDNLNNISLKVPEN